MTSNSVMAVQLQTLDGLDAQAATLASDVARKVVQQMRQELADLSDGGVVWEMVSSFKMVLEGTAFSAFNDHCEALVLRPLQDLAQALPVAEGEAAAWPSGNIEWALTHASLELRQALAPVLQSLLKKAQPSAFSLLGRFFKDEFGDGLDQISDDMEADGLRLRQQFAQHEGQLHTLVQQAAQPWLQQAVADYRQHVQSWAAASLV